ncbi:MAG TPA: hypothetical protein VIT92_11945 [Burkholderiaceae bacterium]
MKLTALFRAAVHRIQVRMICARADRNVRKAIRASRKPGASK